MSNNLGLITQIWKNWKDTIKKEIYAVMQETPHIRLAKLTEITSYKIISGDKKAPFGATFYDPIQKVNLNGYVLLTPQFLWEVNVGDICLCIPTLYNSSEILNGLSIPSDIVEEFSDNCDNYFGISINNSMIKSNPSAAFTVGTHKFTTQTSKPSANGVIPSGVKGGTLYPISES